MDNALDIHGSHEDAIRAALKIIERRFAPDADKWEADAQLTLEAVEAGLRSALAHASAQVGLRHAGETVPVGMANADNIRNPDYLLARIQQALDAAAEQAARTTLLEPEQVEGIVLKSLITLLACDLNLFTAAADELLVALRADHPKIRWGRAATHYGAAPDERTAEQVATAMQLVEEDTAGSERRWSGLINDFSVSIFSPLS
ncbi:hypothetical protein [Nocardia testacea]|uniref:hypothetical protein n=1 Tax=Nocardia testacea TaxID=248551 RepID=UPI0033CD7DCB